MYILDFLFYDLIIFSENVKTLKYCFCYFTMMKDERRGGDEESIFFYKLVRIPWI